MLELDDATLAAWKQPRRGEHGKRRRSGTGQRRSTCSSWRRLPRARWIDFYFQDVKEQDSLFRNVARGVLGAEPHA